MITLKKLNFIVLSLALFTTQETWGAQIVQVMQEISKEVSACRGVQLNGVLEELDRYDRETLEESDQRLAEFSVRFSREDGLKLTDCFLKTANQVIALKKFAIRADITDFERIYNTFLRLVAKVFHDQPVSSLYHSEPSSFRNILAMESYPILLNLKSDEPTYAKVQELTRFVDLENLNETLRELDGIDSSKPSIKYLLVRYTKNPHRPHILPLFLKIDREQMRIIALDVAGLPFQSDDYGTKYREMAIDFAEQVSWHIDPDHSFRHRPVLWVQYSTRQFADLSSCGITAFTDLLRYDEEQMAAHLNVLFERGLVHALPNEQGNRPGRPTDIKIFRYLPTRLMQSMQSAQEIEDYKKETQECQINSTEQLLDLEIDLAKFTLNCGDGFVNFYARARFFEFSEALLRHALNLKE
jgi:hypothetical protein